MLTIYIGNKNYSSWSMRPWVLLRQAGIPFREVMVRFDSFEAGSAFRQTVGALNPAGKVPVLVDEGLVIWDTLAIAEYLAETFPAHALWPADRRARARARSVCAEMHSGFAALRRACPMNIEARLPDIGALALRDQPAVRADLERLITMWTGLLTDSGADAAPPEAAARGEAGFLFGAFGIADAYFAPVVMRIRTYALPVPPAVQAWIDRLLATDGVRAWIEDALAEQDFLDFEEPYRLGRAG